MAWCQSCFARIFSFQQAILLASPIPIQWKNTHLLEKTRLNTNSLKIHSSTVPVQQSNGAYQKVVMKQCRQWATPSPASVTYRRSALLSCGALLPQSFITCSKGPWIEIIHISVHEITVCRVVLVGRILMDDGNKYVAKSCLPCLIVSLQRVVSRVFLKQPTKEGYVLFRVLS